jgi:Tol biopolymer transport system component
VGETGWDKVCMMAAGERLIGLLASIIALCGCSEARSQSEAEAKRWTPAALSTPGYEATPTFAPDGSMIYLAADAGFQHYQLAQTRCVNGVWSAGAPLPFGMPLPVNDADPFLTPDGQRLYYVSTRGAAGKEDFDIWTVARTSDGSWGTPERPPEPVNSSGSELLPRMDMHGRLYFGSDRPGGHGQGDIYVATQNAAGNRTVTNAGSPISTPAFEYEAEISRDGRTMIVVAGRGDKSHLYRYRLDGKQWREVGRIPASATQFQVGPLLSPNADRLLFAQRDGADSGEMFLIDLASRPDRSWPPTCD